MSDLWKAEIVEHVLSLHILAGNYSMTLLIHAHICFYMFGKDAKLILDLVMPKFTVQFALLQDLIKNEQDRFLEWEKDVSHLDLSHCNRLTVCYVVDKYHVTWSFQELQSEHILKSWMNSSPPKLLYFYITFQLAHDVHVACEKMLLVKGLISSGRHGRFAQRSFLQNKNSSSRSFAHGVLLGGKVGGPIERHEYHPLSSSKYMAATFETLWKQGIKGRFFAEKKDTGRDSCEFLSHARLLDVKQITKRAFCWLRRRSQTFFPGFKWWGHPRCSISVTWWLKGWRYHVIGHDV